MEVPQSQVPRSRLLHQYYVVPNTLSFAAESAANLFSKPEAGSHVSKCLRLEQNRIYRHEIGLMDPPEVGDFFRQKATNSPSNDTNEKEADHIDTATRAIGLRTLSYIPTIFDTTAKKDDNGKSEQSGKESESERGKDETGEEAERVISTETERHHQ